MDNNNIFQQSKYLSAFVASNIGAITKTVALTPMDVIMTRLYNQGKIYICYSPLPVTFHNWHQI